MLRWHLGVEVRIRGFLEELYRVDKIVIVHIASFRELILLCGGAPHVLESKEALVRLVVAAEEKLVGAISAYEGLLVL